MSCCNRQAAGRGKPPLVSSVLVDSDNRPPGNAAIKKLVIVGNSGVGKTAILTRLKDHSKDPKDWTPLDTAPSTIGVDFWRDKSDASPIGRIQFWDTAGQERFRALLPSYYRSCYAVVAVFNLTDTLSYQALNSWIHEAFENVRDDDHKVSLLVIGTQKDKISVPDRPRVDLSHIKEYVGREIDYYGELSSVKGSGFKTFVKALAELAETGDISKTRSHQMDLLGIKEWAKESAEKARSKRRQRKVQFADDAPDNGSPAAEPVELQSAVENPLPIITE